MSSPGHWDVFYIRQTGLLLINYYDIDLRTERMNVWINSYIPSQRRCDLSVVPVCDVYPVFVRQV